MNKDDDLYKIKSQAEQSSNVQELRKLWDDAGSLHPVNRELQESIKDFIDKKINSLKDER